MCHRKSVNEQRTVALAFKVKAVHHAEPDQPAGGSKRGCEREGANDEMTAKR